jgi:hypothetical protein
VVLLYSSDLGDWIEIGFTDAPEQAIEILDQMTARAPATRADHALAQQALAVLRQVVNGDDLEAQPSGPRDPSP